MFGSSPLIAAVVATALSTPAQALDIGPWTLTGFAKAEIQRGTALAIALLKHLAE